MKERRKLIQYSDYIISAYPEYTRNKENAESINADRKSINTTFTFQVTDAYNLACKYCYQTNKSTRRMSFETAKMAIDNLLTGDKNFNKFIDPEINKSIVLEFIGGEPLLEIDLIDQIVHYFRYETIKRNHIWAQNFRISICTNGILYNDPKVQKFLQKYQHLLSFSITIDGTKELHDSCRVFPDGRPSYDIAHAAACDWKSRGNYLGSKITISPDNIKYLADSLIQMVDENYYDINANCVNEKGWKLEHAQELYKQIKRFADYERDKTDNLDYAISLLLETFGRPMDINHNKNWCGGTGEILAMDPDGNLYPCLRYMESSLGNSQKPYIVGNVKTGSLGPVFFIYHI